MVLQGNYILEGWKTCQHFSSPSLSYPTSKVHPGSLSNPKANSKTPKDGVAYSVGPQVSYGLEGGDPYKYFSSSSWRVTWKNATACKQRRTYFAILGVSFCVTKNAFNFIKIKKQEHRGTVKQVFYSHMSYFLKLMQLLLLFVLHKKNLIATAPFLFLMVSG